MRLDPPLCLPFDVVLAWTDPRRRHVIAGAYDVEKMRPKRLAEFSAGRAAAATALGAFDIYDSLVLQGEDRAPIWPEGIAGSISHSGDLCVAGVSRSLRGFGIDLEALTPLPQAEAQIVTHAQDRVSAWPPELSSLAIFCAKEACYKAQYPLSRQLFGFETLAVEIAGTDFVARFLHRAMPFEVGDAIQGKISIHRNHLLAMAWL